MKDLDPPQEVALIRAAIKKFFQTRLAGDPQNPTIGSCKCGVYAFYDYDGEPIYVGQTYEGLSARVGRHLTGRRSDAVGKFVLDPFEVLEIEVWPMPGIALLPTTERKKRIAEAEYAVFSRALMNSKFKAVLNEKAIAEQPEITLPPSYRGRIIPDELLVERSNPDVRLARRAMTIASLARLISERQVRVDLRQTLLVQCQRLQALAAQRVEANLALRDLPSSDPEEDDDAQEDGEYDDE